MPLALSSASPLPMSGPAGEPVGFFNTSQVLEITTYSRTTLWREVRRGAFPRPVTLSKARKGWRKSDVFRWISEREGATHEAA